MKTKILFIILLIVSLANTSCNLEEFNNDPTNDAIHGEWNMKDASGGFFPQNDIEVGALKFIFDTNNMVLTVENNDETLSLVPDSGHYPYSIIEFENKNYILFEEESMQLEFQDEIYGFEISFVDLDGEQALFINHNEVNSNAINISDNTTWLLLR